MCKLIKKLTGMIFVIVLLLLPRTATAATFEDINNSSVFVKQQSSSTCTLASTAMMVRRAAMLSGNSNWDSITENSMRSTAWSSSGLYNSFSYAGINVKSVKISSNRTQTMINLLASHPEGIVIYDFEKPHAILLTDYTDGVFYCADPSSAAPKGRIPISQATIKVESIDKYWYVSSPQLSLTDSSNNNPEGYLDGVEGGTNTVRVTGWAFDPNDVSRSIEIHIYIGGPAGTGECYGGIIADIYREDVNRTYGIGGYHGFDFNIQTSLVGMQSVYVYAINIGKGTNQLIGTDMVHISADTMPPNISNLQITDITKDGYTVQCTVTDNVGVDRVEFPTWTERNGQDDLKWESGTRSGDTWTFHVDVKDHNNEDGYYATHIYAYDKSGNGSSIQEGTVYVDRTAPQISDVSVTDTSVDGYTVQCTVTDNAGVDRVEFPTWTEKNGQDDILWEKGTNLGNHTYQFRVRADAHNKEQGDYITHIYAYDAAGNSAVASTGTIRIRAEEEQQGFANKEYFFNTIDGKRVSTKASGSKATVIIFGRVTCGNSQYTVSSVEKSKWAGSDEIQVIFAEFDKAGLEETKKFAQSCGEGKIKYCYSTGDDIQSAMNSYLLAAEIRGTVTLPVIVIIDGNDRVRSVSTGNRTADELLGEIGAFTELPFEQKEDLTLEVSVSGVQNYEYAKEIVEITNEIRREKGLSPLGLDEELTEAAMQRAAEIALYYGHARPDGRECFTVLKRGGTTAENIAAGYKTPQAVAAGWRNSSGHYKNMINENMKSIGIGCFQDSRGTWYWVQYFDDAFTQVMTKAGEETVTKTVLIKKSMLQLMPSSGKTTESFDCRDCTYETKLEVVNVNQGWEPSQPILPSSEFTFESSNPMAAEVNTEGKITVKAAGTAVITAKLKADPSLYIEYTVTKAEHQYSDSVVAPTARKDGYTLHTCMGCGASYMDSFVPRTKKETSGAITDGDKSVQTGDSEDDEEDAANEESSEISEDGREPGDIEELESQTITAKNITKTYGTKAFSLGAKANGGGKLTYTVSDKKVASVSNAGKVTIKGCGVTKITIKAAANKKYKAAEKNITLTVKPKQQKLSSVKSQKAKSIAVKWKKDTKATGYIIQYSTNKTFKKDVKTVTVKKNGTTSKTISKLKGGKKYYVRICSYKQSGKGTIRGAYSPVKAVTVRR